MHRGLCQKLALKATIHDPSFASLSRNDFKDIEDEVFWKAIYCLHIAVFPALLWFQHPCNEQIFFLVKRAEEELLDSNKFFDNGDLFGSMRGVILSDCETKFSEKQTQEKWWFFEINMLLLHTFFKLVWNFCIIFCNHGEDLKFTLGRYGFLLGKSKKQVGACICSHGMGSISPTWYSRWPYDYGDLREMVDEVVSQLHYHLCPNKSGKQKSWWDYWYFLDRI